MTTVKARLQHLDPIATYIAPIAVPDLDEARKVANQLHEKGQRWQGEIFGWNAEYNPEKPTAPLDSKMTFTPADFCIGESGIWFFSMMWEEGRDCVPTEFLDEKSVVSSSLRMVL